MKRVFLLAVPFLLSACGSASTYERECSVEYDRFEDVFACTKEKLNVDPRNMSLPHTLDKPDEAKLRLLDYGEQLNSQVRQGIITDQQAKDSFRDMVH